MRRSVRGGVAAAVAAALCAAVPASALVKPEPPALPADARDFATVQNITTVTGAQTAWRSGVTGKGVDVALIDTGVTPVPGLTSGNVVNGPDFSFDSQNPGQRYLDGFGHGTHMAGLIVGRDAVQTDPSRYADPALFTGMAPDARLVNVKVGAVDGAVDVTQVIAALNWVAEHGQRDGLNVRVVSLSYGTDSVQDARVDPLAHALEAVYRKGITVVVAAGNDGSDKTWLAMPAQSPRALAVGGQDLRGTLDVRDDTVPDFANRGDARRNVDLVAPAVSVQGLRVPGSWVDEHHPEARVGDRLLRGSGTSQAAAITAGAAALYLQRNPSASPDQVKAALQTGAAPMSDGSAATRGNGALDIAGSLGRASNVRTAVEASTGTGTLEGSRGSYHVVDYDETGAAVELRGEVDVFGAPVDMDAWRSETAASTTFTPTGTWGSRGLVGADWTGSSWTSRTWSSRTWSSRTWSSRTWSSRTWSAGSWDGMNWVGAPWDSRTWSSRTWSSGGWQ